VKILLTVGLYNPHRGGAEKVVEDLATSLMAKGHDVTVATAYLSWRGVADLRGVKVESFKLGGNTATGIKGDEQEIKRYRDFIINGEYDVVFNYTAQIWSTDLTFPILDKIKAVKILAPVGYSRLKSSRYKDYFKTLPAYLERYDKLVYHSPNYQDKIFGDESGLGDKAVVISNGALRSEFLANGKDKTRDQLRIKTPYLFIVVSHHNVAKGHRFVIRAFRKMKRKDATLVIIGDRMVSSRVNRVIHFMLDYMYCFVSSLLNKNIKLVDGKDRDDVLSLYKSADISFSGSWLECAPLVMYESFASKAPFISTDVGNVSDYKDYLKVIKTPSEMAKAADYLIDHPGERNALSKKAYDLWEKERSVEDIVGQYESLFESLNDERS